jgi:hypothetical protein
MYCECGQKLSQEEIESNEAIANETQSKNLGMCKQCWYDYCTTQLQEIKNV